MNRIADLRKQHGYTQVELAKLLGIAQNTLSQYETGYRRPTTKVIMNMAKILEVSTNELLGYSTPCSGNSTTPPALALSGVTKVKQTFDSSEANLLISLGWKLLHVGAYSQSNYDSTGDACTQFTLGWFGDPYNAPEYKPDEPGTEYEDWS